VKPGGVLKRAGRGKRGGSEMRGACQKWPELRKVESDYLLNFKIVFLTSLEKCVVYLSQYLASKKRGKEDGRKGGEAEGVLWSFSLLEGGRYRFPLK